MEKKDPERKIVRHSEREARKISSEQKKRSLALRARDDKSLLGMTKSRYIPQSLKREIWKRDKGKCTFQSKDGKQCNETGILEIDHVKPFALNGKNELENLRLLCSSHNKWRSQVTFGSIPI